MTTGTQGKLSEKPLGELIREIAESSASGALRLKRDLAKAVVYFEKGAVVFAASNIRAHRLSEYLRRSGLVDDKSLAELPAQATDKQLLDLVLQERKAKPEQINNIRANHVADILRTTLLWTEGDWQLDARVRIAGNTRVTIDARRLLLESTRHLPASFIAARFPDFAEQVELARNNGYSPNLDSSEGFVLARVSGLTTVRELLLGGLSEADTLRAIYGLAMIGLLRRATWTKLLLDSSAEGAASRGAEAESEALEDFLERVEKTADHYEALGVGRQATADQIKNVYHSLARRYHPDRFHKADAAMRTRIESAFATIARAYDTLRAAGSRAAYDLKIGVTPSPAKSSNTSAPKPARNEAAEEDRAESSFQKGLAAVKQNQPQQALRFFAEAASLDPRRARYRAEYGQLLSNDPRTRRLAEIELKAAIDLEPGNVAYRVALAELYKAIGLRRRAESELQRALIADPKNEAARKLLATLKN